MSRDSVMIPQPQDRQINLYYYDFANSNVILKKTVWAGGEMANALALGANAERLAGSSPALPTILR